MRMFNCLQRDTLLFEGKTGVKSSERGHERKGRGGVERGISLGGGGRGIVGITLKECEEASPCEEGLKVRRRTLAV